MVLRCFDAESSRPELARLVRVVPGLVRLVGVAEEAREPLAAEAFHLVAQLALDLVQLLLARPNAEGCSNVPATREDLYIRDTPTVREA